MNPFLAGLLALVAIIGVLLTLELTGKTDMGLKKFFSGGGEVRAGNDIAVVLNSVALQPGQQVTKEALWNPQQGTFFHTYVDKDRVAEKEYLADPGEVLGRVLRRPKAAGLAFTEADFLPMGSAPGITGLVPDGMSALSIPADRIPGLGLLGFADRFDLRMNVESDEGAQRVAREILEDRSYSSEQDRLRLASIVQGPEPRLMAQAGAVLRPSNPAAIQRNEKIVVAVFPEDLNGLIAALDSKGDIYCSPRKKSPEGVYERVEVIERDPMDEYAWVLEISREVEMIAGDQSEIHNVPSAHSTLQDVARLDGDSEPK